MKKILGYLNKYKSRMLVGLIIKILGTFMDLGLPWILAFIIDDVTPQKEILPIVLWGGGMILLSIAARQFNIMANRMASKVARDVTQEIREDVFAKVLSMSSSQIDKYTIPSLVTRLTSDTYNIHQMVGMMQRLGVRAPIILLGGMIVTMTLEPVLSLIILAILPLLGVCVYYISKKGIPLFQKTQKANDNLVRVVRENITGIRVIKALSKTDYETGRFTNVNEEMVQNELKAQNTMAITGPIMNLVLNFGLTVVVVVGAFRVNGGYSEVGKIVAFLSYFTIMLQAVIAITRIFVVFSKSSASAERIAAVLNEEADLSVMTQQELSEKVEEELEKKLEEELVKEELEKKLEDELLEKSKANQDEVTACEHNTFEGGHSSHIQFKHVQFSYDKTGEETCLKEIDFSLKRGESLGIIGSTGSGKTTIVNLLMRFYDPDDGQILLDGRDIRTLQKKELREKFGVVFQNDTIFADTIANNIDFNRGLSREEVQRAAQYAQASSFIEAISEQYDYPLAAKGVNLSGGQKQRVLISRALAKQPEILILDDSSSALDYKTDASLRKELRNHYADTTMILIAQRISSIMTLSKILVLEEGEMIGLGTHEELLASCSVYQEIYQSQMGEEAGLTKVARKGGVMA